MTTRTVSELAELCGATLEGDGARPVVGPAALDQATEEEVSFLANPRYAPLLADTRAAAVLVARDLEAPAGRAALLRCDHPSRAFSRVIEAFRPPGARPLPGIHPSAVVEPGARVAASASVGARCWVGPGAVIEDDVVLQPGAIVGPECRIGPRTQVCYGAVLYPRTELGRDCIVHGGVVLGADGFGFEPTEDGWEKIPQCGNVVVEDDVEIGAGSTVDRGRFGPTRILRGTKIDNLVHVAHNVTVGPEALLVAQVGVSGSARIGRRVVLAGQAGVAGHVEVGDGARIAGRAGVTKSLPGGRDYAGYPAQPRAEHHRAQVHVGRLEGMARRLRELERRVAELSAVRPAVPNAPEGGEG